MSLIRYVLYKLLINFYIFGSMNHFKPAALEIAEIPVLIGLEGDKRRSSSATPSLKIVHSGIIHA